MTKKRQSSSVISVVEEESLDMQALDETSEIDN